MTGMHWVLVSLAVLAVSALAVMGVAGIALGRVPAWGRRRVLRPKLWGYGAVVSAVGMTGFMFLGPLSDAPPAYIALPLAGMAANFVGLVMQMLAQRPGRTPGTLTGRAS
jgi:hypothetical protein